MPTIQKRGNTYRIRASVSYDNVGRQIMRSMTYSPAAGMTQRQIQKELERQAVLFEERVRSGHIADGSIKFSTLVEKWFMEYADKQLAAKTIHEYKRMWTRIEAAVGHIRLDRLKPIHFQELYNNLQEDGTNIKSGGTLSPNSVRHYHAMLSGILNTAVIWGYISESPLRIKPPKPTQKEAAHLEESQAAALLDALEGEPIPYKAMVHLLLHTGARKGEVLGLEWKDIDFDRQLIHIVRSSQYIPGQGVITKEPKNKTSQRVIKLPASLFALLRQLQREQMIERVKLGDRWQQCDRLFTQWDGAPIHPDSLPRWFTLFLKRHGLPYINIHGLRHTCASLMIAGHVDIRTVANRLGHATPSTTATRYGRRMKPLRM